VSFLNRLAARIAAGPTPAQGPRPVTLRPKGLTGRLARVDEEEEATALRRQGSGTPARRGAPLSRQAAEEEEEEAQPLRRLDSEEEEQAQALRRQGREGAARRSAGLPRQEHEEEEEVQALRRQEREEEEAEGLQAARLARQATEEGEEEEAQALRRQEREEEEPAQPLRRQEQEEEEGLQAARLRRQPAEEEEEEEEEAQALLRRQEHEEEALQGERLARQETGEEEEAELQALRRQGPDLEGLDPETANKPEELAGEPEPPTALAVRRSEAGPAPVAPVEPGPPPPGGDGRAPFAGPDAPLGGPLDLDLTPPGPVVETPPPGFTRPSVLIEQLDVLIHEPSPARPGAGRRQERSRAVRARLLRRL
jgi:hypothetical protein